MKVQWQVTSVLILSLNAEIDRVSCTRFRRHQVRCFMELEVRHGETEVYARVQA
jgi:hypothetical protein